MSHCGMMLRERRLRRRRQRWRQQWRPRITWMVTMRPTKLSPRILRLFNEWIRVR